MKMNWRLLNYITLFVTISVLVISFFAPREVFAEEELKLNALASIVIDAKTGKIFYEENSDTPLPIASMTKLITLYLVLEAVEQGDLAWDEKIEISDHLFEISQDMSLSNIPFVKGRSYTVLDLFNASTIISANAAITALAERIAGTETNFITMMQEKVTSWGIKDAYLISTSGINNEDSGGRVYPGSQDHEENLLSARSMALVAQHLITDFPLFLNTTKMPSALFSPGTDEEAEMISSNWMLPGFSYEKAGVDGLKTGTTDLAGACFVGTIEQKEWRLITVVMNAENAESDGGLRFTDTATLMDFVYDNWQYETLYPKGGSLTSLKTLPLAKGKIANVPVVTDEKIAFWVEKHMNKENLDITLLPQDPLYAPLKKGEEVGQATISFPEDTYGYLDGGKDEYLVSLIADSSVKKANWLVLAARAVKNLFTAS